jgi:hypothetical protein
MKPRRLVLVAGVVISPFLLGILLQALSILQAQEALPGSPAGGKNQPPVLLSVWADPQTVVLPAGAMVGAVAQDPEGKALSYTWAKVFGPGNVSFAPNGTAGASEAEAAFYRPGDRPRDYGI